MASAEKKEQPAKEGSPYTDEEATRFKNFFRPVNPRDISNIQASDKHFLTAVSLAHRNETRCPDFQKEEEIQEEIQALSDRLTYLKKYRPEGFLDDGGLIVKQIAALKVKIEVSREEFDSVMKAWSQSWKKREHCITINEFQKAKFWNLVFESSQQVILPFLKYKEAKEKEAQKKRAAEQRLVRVCDAEVATSAEAAASAQAPAAAEQDESPISASKRSCLPRQQKILESLDQLAKQPPTATNIPAFKGNWANWLTQPWTYKKKDRKGHSKHGNGLRLSADKRVYCGFCGCHIRKDKTGQHLGGDGHHRRYLENKASAVLGAAVISLQTIPEAAIRW
jgi:hypothetical protein